MINRLLRAAHINRPLSTNARNFARIRTKEDTLSKGIAFFFPLKPDEGREMSGVVRRARTALEACGRVASAANTMVGLRMRPKSTV
jgi:hypothetical protein